MWIMILLFNLLSDVVANIIFFFQVEVNVIPRNKIFLEYIYACFIALGLVITIFRIYNYEIIAINLVYKKHINEIISKGIVFENLYLMVSMLSDFQIFCIQF